MPAHHVDTDQLPWRASPSAGVEWKKLYFDARSGRSTVLLRFAPGARYAAHRHPSGEDYYVLSGTLQDGDKRYGAGTYVHLPPGSSHGPCSDTGCLVLVWLGAPIETI